MSSSLAFDVYGTLIDPGDVIRQLRPWLAGEADGFYRRWRDKQLEYSFRRGLMGAYVDFAQCTREALTYLCAAEQAPLDEQAQHQLCAAWTTLPAFADSGAGLAALQRRGVLFIACNNALTFFYDLIAEARQLDAATVGADIRANLLPGVVVVPAMVIAIEKAQGRGLAYNRQ